MESGRACCYATDGTTMGDNGGLEVVVVVAEGLRYDQRERDTMEALPGRFSLVAKRRTFNTSAEYWSGGSASSTCGTRRPCDENKAHEVGPYEGIFYRPAWLLLWPGETRGP